MAFLKSGSERTGTGEIVRFRRQIPHILMSDCGDKDNNKTARKFYDEFRF